MFLSFRSIVRCFQCFVHGLSPLGKKFPMNSPSPSEFPMIFRGGGGYGYFLEPHIKDSLLLCPLMGLDIKKTCNQNKILLHDKIFESLKY